MIDALVSGVLGQLRSIVVEEVSDELKLLEGVETEIETLKTNFDDIKDVLEDAEKRSLKEEGTLVRKWLERLKQVCYDMEDVLDEWRTDAVLRQQQQQQRQAVHCASWLVEKVMPCISSLIPWIRRPIWMHNIALKIKDINQRLDDVVKGKDRFNFNTGTTIANEPESPQTQTTSFGDHVPDFDGRKAVKESLISRLLSESSQEEEEHHNVSITAIVGMGGIGKTTLAREAFNDEDVKKHFDKPSEKRRVWVCVSRPFDATNVARAILEGLNCGTSGLPQLENMLQKISVAIKDEKFLLVLDDVWNEDDKRWEPLRDCLKNGAQGSKILVTTRSERVAKMMRATNPIPLEKLSDKDCWSIFSHHAFFGKSKDKCEHLKVIGRQMSDRCKGLPLAAKVLGRLMSSKESSAVEWQEVLDSDLWELKEANNDIYPVFMLSYHDLPSPMKRCFIYCAIFPEDHVFGRNRLIQLWMANGFLEGEEMEMTGKNYFESLAMRSLFQDLERGPISDRIVRCRMHDLVREFALRLSKNECGEIEVYYKEENLMMQELLDCAKLRHVRLTCKSGGEHSSSSSSSLSKFSINGLRTLVSGDLKGPNAEKKVLGGLFCGLTSLRTLELKDSIIKELPVEIGKLMHLRYLGLESSYLEALPETACDLFNLQTLRLNWCHLVKRLPRGTGKLLNLRHLEFLGTQIMELPKGFGELTSLRTLSGRILISRDDNDKEEECFGIGDSEKLNCLENLNLTGLGNAELLDVVAGEAKRARLNNKKSMRMLALGFEPMRRACNRLEAIVSNEFSSEEEYTEDSEDSEEEEEEEEAVQLAKNDLSMAEALLEEPPPHLEVLRFTSYRGTKLPSKVTLLSGLKALTLYNCPNLEALPDDIFERLPLLRQVYIRYPSPALAEYCKRRMRENPALASVFDIGRLRQLKIR